MSVKKVRPLHDRVVVKRALEEERSKGGIVIPDTAKEKPIKGEVVAVGPGKRFESGELCSPAVKVGEKVLFGKYSLKSNSMTKNISSCAKMTSWQPSKIN